MGVCCASEYCEYYQQIRLIQKMDWIKAELSRIGGTKVFFKDIIADPNHRAELEKLFEVPFYRIKYVYRKLLHERNAICHKYTMAHWDFKRV